MSTSRRAKVIGIIGAIGAGKTRVANYLGHLGALVIHGDDVGHEVINEPAIQQQLIAIFGAEVMLGDQINRQWLGRQVFSDPAKMQRLEAVVHPEMKRRFSATIARGLADPETPLVVFDAAILLEAGWRDRVDDLLFVDASLKTRLARVAERGWSADELARREKSQWPLERKRAAANYLLINDHWETSVADLDKLFAEWTANRPQSSLAAQS